MSPNPKNLSQAIHSILNDVVEQCFRQLMQQPDQRPYIESIIDRATNDIINLDRKSKEPLSESGFTTSDEQNASITKMLHNRSLKYLGELQKIQESASTFG